MYQFDYVKPKSLAEASKLAANEDAKLMSGGQTLIPTMKQRLARPSQVIDIGDLAELKGIKLEGSTLIIGAGSRHNEVASSDVVKRAIPALAYLASHIGDPAVRHRGTMGGSIANNDPAADYPAALVALGAEVRTTKRAITADNFFVGMFETALEPGEIVQSISFPVPKRAAYEKFPNPASRYAMVGVFVAETAKGIRVAITGAGPGVFRSPEMEAALAKSFTPKAVEAIKISPNGLNSDIHGSAEYRAHLVTVMASRAVAKAV
ncbi:MAG: xanthine dehydrogenase family protein subunit M [Alphaproteobacteria bacterium]